MKAHNQCRKPNCRRIRWHNSCFCARHQLRESLYECDVCGQCVTRDELAIVFAYGIETAACAKCRGAEEDLENYD